ncbi:hypothetical protein RFI_33016 [Reticulomyxa filosa]|uniref:Uncharacterized protein n=1 Tax=Reticulomyxa filosa TaxID=46433 RepID=X6LRB0_RETFI|nr:hypothetical protein RFI_33016 [Reticulomyxa filosa]|eukprot:ETO04383.1 hypothetical protein RFI_33016 [Reticulomyxa filosa]
MWKLEQWNECIGNYNSFFLKNEKQKTCKIGTPGDSCDLSAIKEVVEKCLECKCKIPQEILDRLAEESLQQKHSTEVPQLQHIVQKFQELTEDKDTKSLLKECTQIVIHCDHRSDQPLDSDEKSNILDTTTRQTRPFRIYAFVAETDQPTISFLDDRKSQLFFLNEISPPFLLSFNEFFNTQIIF